MDENTGMTARVNFSIKYDGPALATHQMDVRELAPALIALSELLQEANRVAYPDAPDVRVNVHGSFKGGSFQVDLSAVQTIAQQLVSIFDGPNATAAANLSGILSGIGMLGAGGAGLIGLIRWLRGRRPSSIRLEGDRAIVEIVENEVTESVSVDLVAGRLYRSRKVRQSLARVIRPLERPGVESFACGADGHALTVVVDKADVPFFESAATDADVVSDTVSEGVLLQIEHAVFKEANKWKFSDGATSFFAEITDEEFLAKVDAGTERFGKGDVLVVDLRRIQSVSEAGLRVECSIVKVRDHRAPLQSPLL